MRDLGYDVWTVPPETQIVFLFLASFALLVFLAWKIVSRIAPDGFVWGGILVMLQLLQAPATLLTYYLMFLPPGPLGQLQGYGIVLYCLSLFVCFPIAWRYYRQGNQTYALQVTVLPLLWLITLIIAIALTIFLLETGLHVSA